MARIARVVVPGYPHHVTQRGNRRQQTLFCHDDYITYRTLIAKACRECGTEVWAYCLMPNHVHLVLVPQYEDSLRDTLAEAHRRYTRQINFREGWRGHLWQERFHSFVMDERYLLATVRYVERNPVAARLCLRPQQWRWSSARAHLAGADDELVQVKPMLDRITDWPAYIGQAADQAEIDNLRKHARTGRPLGDAGFIDRLELLLGKTLCPQKRGPKTGCR
jgi:putative transposase